MKGLQIEVNPIVLGSVRWESQLRAVQCMCIGENSGIKPQKALKRHPQLTLQKVKQKSTAKLCQFDLNHWIVKFVATLGRHETSPFSFIKVLICLREINYILLLLSPCEQSE